MRMQFSSALAEKVTRSVMSVLQSVCFYYIVVTFTLVFARVLVMNIAQRRMKVKVLSYRLRPIAVAPPGFCNRGK